MISNNLTENTQKTLITMQWLFIDGIFHHMKPRIISKIVALPQSKLLSYPPNYRHKTQRKSLLSFFERIVHTFYFARACAMCGDV